MANERRIVLIPEMPADLDLDFVFETDRGVAVRASDATVQVLRDRGIPVAELFRSSNEYAGAVLGLPREQALAAIESVQNAALAALSTEERGRFRVA
ncbi:MAG: hypothetical protein HY330_01585 [Chloroflexi bacterium]|nr:hypothetical protein [Chloroflexota bacterium]